ncbi:related to ERO1 protein, required for protein disulfide bond formation in the ER [Ramularia collo-cygni]|uniref:Related to ERO1 protein, required for protein disulfide bond formation in the ER n=1 Tax=Ramularia collo-cygni TaxID=112498 RepID=A0A2D3UYP7_9PEZI|nr:related to ERO1 protein, required for protein disulfide bond formation in the ER [Ramularia collo-cygni]CZT19505.1 related to ERO1 protein, required for protein disulfide bond formation in the ER [Ramularia collo-cygni]
MRRPGVPAVCLAVLALLSNEGGVSAAPPSSVSSYASPDSCALEPKAQVSDACASYADLNTLNDRLHPYVRNLANNTDFFSYYRLNLYNKKCPFWSDENSLCGNRACAVDTLDNEEDIPLIWRASELSKLEGPKAHHPGKKQQRERQRPLMGELGDDVGESCVVEYDDECDERDYCVPEDESASGKGDYVSLADNLERFTGYSGEGPHQVWEAIYRENCFSKALPNKLGASVPGLSPPVSGFSFDQAQAAQEFKQVVKARDRQQAIQSGGTHDALDFEDECIEKRVFYRVISGMHASISTHLCYDYLNQTTGEWGPNLECYKERLHTHPEWISNLYFNYALVLRAVGKLRDYVQDYTFCTGDPSQDTKTKKMITVLADAIPAGPQIFDENVMFQDNTADGISLKEDFRNRFRNVSRIMDCVGCDKCRLWGKVQTAGFGTALKVLFEFGNDQVGQEKPLLRRTELVALINTLDKISSAMKALEHFKLMLQAEQDGKTTAEIERVSDVVRPSIVTNFDDLDDLDDFEDYSTNPKKPSKKEQTIKEIFWEELNVVWSAYMFVLSSWVEMPFKISSIVALEVERLYSFWLGRPMKPRSWEIRFPKKDEL